MEKPYLLTDDEANLIKDILKACGSIASIDIAISRAVGMPHHKFMRETDKIFRKLGNGRVTVIQS